MAKERKTSRKKDLLFTLNVINNKINQDIKFIKNNYKNNKKEFGRVLIKESKRLKIPILFSNNFLGIKSDTLKGSCYRTLELLHNQRYIKIIKTGKKGNRYLDIKITKKGMNIISS